MPHLTPAQSSALRALAETRWGPKHQWLCVYCGRGAGMTVDHFVPRSAGGSDDLANLVPACDRCQLSKSDRPPIAWMVAAGVPERRILTLARVTGSHDYPGPLDPNTGRPRMPQIAATVLDYYAANQVPRLSASDGLPGSIDLSDLPGAVLDQTAWTARSELLALARSINPTRSRQDLYRSLEARGFPPSKRNGVRGHRGLRVSA